MTFEEQYAAYRAQLNSALKSAVPGAVPAPLNDAMRYSLLSGGKRLRGVLVLAATHMAGGKVQDALPFAMAMEMLHAYSLIHDDLPALDNDTLRRGQPTCHVQYGEAVALLAGDGLQALAFETMLHSPHPHAFSAARIIADAAGVTGMIAGQTLDVVHEGEAPDETLLRAIHLGKTARMIAAPVAAGLTLAGACPSLIDAGTQYGQQLGLAFQIIDDLLDVIGDEKLMGKTLGKDAREGKLTWVALRGTEKARQDAKAMTQCAISALDPFGDKGEFLKTLALDMLSRVQ